MGAFGKMGKMNSIAYELQNQHCSHTWFVDDRPCVCESEPIPEVDDLAAESQDPSPSPIHDDDPMSCSTIGSQPPAEMLHFCEETEIVEELPVPAQKQLTPELTRSLRKRISIFDVVKSAQRKSFREKIDAIREIEG